MLQFPDSYFEDEVRDGFYVPSMIKRAWATALDVLCEVDRICCKYDNKILCRVGNTSWSSPPCWIYSWDDDLDIGMMRTDYRKFCEVAPKEFNESFQIFTFNTQKDFHHFLARVVCKNRICFEDEHLRRFHGFPYIAGLDIFVHDNVSDDAMLQENDEKDSRVWHKGCTCAWLFTRGCCRACDGIGAHSKSSYAQGLYQVQRK